MAKGVVLRENFFRKSCGGKNITNQPGFEIYSGSKANGTTLFNRIKSPSEVRRVKEWSRIVLRMSQSPSFLGVLEAVTMFTRSVPEVDLSLLVF